MIQPSAPTAQLITNLFAKAVLGIAATVALLASPGIVKADLVITDYQTDVTMLGMTGNMLISSSVVQSSSGGGAASFMFDGLNQSDLESGDFYTLTAEAGYDVIPFASQKLTFVFDNSAGATAATATFRIEGTSSFMVSGATSAGPFEGKATVVWENRTGIEGFKAFNPVVNNDAFVQDDFPVLSEWTVTFAAGASGLLNVSTRVESFGGTAIPEPSSLFLFAAVASLAGLGRRRRSF